jgi:hypothetical protein
MDTGNNLFIADSFNSCIRKVTPGGIISSVAGNGALGAWGFGGDGGPALSATFNIPNDVALDTTGNLFIADHFNHRVRKVTLEATEASVATYFPQVAIGGGYVTLFTATNTGSTAASGTISLKDQQGNPFTVNGTLTDSFGTLQGPFPGSSFNLTIPAGGTVFLSVSALNSNDQTRAGWAKLESTGGSVTGVATYEYGGTPQTMVGVLQSQLLRFATIPIDNNSAQTKQMAYAIANPSSQTIFVRLALVDQNGAVVDDSITVTIGPEQQTARYLYQDLAARTNFKGSLVLRGQSGASFVAVALLQKQGLYTVIPLIPGKASGIPD